MSWLSRQFEKKRGGTRLGNMIRQIAYDQTRICTEHLLGTNVNGMNTEERFNTINPNASL